MKTSLPCIVPLAEEELSRRKFPVLLNAKRNSVIRGCYAESPVSFHPGTGASAPFALPKLGSPHRDSAVHVIGECDTSRRSLPTRYEKATLLSVFLSSGARSRASVKQQLKPPSRITIPVLGNKKMNQERVANDSACAKFRRCFAEVMEELRYRFRFQTSEVHGRLLAVARFSGNLRHARSVERPPVYFGQAQPSGAERKPTALGCRPKPQARDTSCWRSHEVEEDWERPVRLARAYSERWKCLVVPGDTSANTSKVSVTKTMSSTR